jgi:hypothetical protein
MTTPGGTDMTPMERIYSLAELYLDEETRPRGRPMSKASMLDVPAWVEEHLSGISIAREKTWNGAVIYELSECPFDPSHRAPDSMIIQQPSGAVGFKCFHASCQGYGWKELREKYDPKGNDEERPRKPKKRPREEIEADVLAISQDTGLPTIELNDRQLREVEQEALDAVTAAGKDDPLVYVRGDKLARIVEDSKGNPKIDTLTSEAIPGILSRVANFVRTNGPAVVGVFPPSDLARAIVNRGKWPFPPLHGVVEIPVLREDGTILDSPGYDRASGLFYIPNGRIPQIKAYPTKQDAEDAGRFVVDVLSDFPFQDEAGHDNAVGLLLTVVVKEFVGLAPMALIDAPAQGTGKGKLAQLVSIVATGRELPVATEVKEDDEWRKQITSTLLADCPVVIIDNVERTLASPHLAAVLTSPEWQDRLLGRSETLRLYARAVWIATGNNIRLGGDIPRRSYWIRLNAQMARPWTRDPRGFKRELPSWAIEHRSDIVAALLTMARAWFLADKPDWSGRPLGSYEKWSRVVGGILEFCGLKKFLSNLEELYEQTDDDPAQWSEFIGDIFAAFTDSAGFAGMSPVERNEKDKSISSGIDTLGGNDFCSREKNTPREISTAPFSVNQLVKRLCVDSGENGIFEGNYLSQKKINTFPESLGDPKDRGFSKRLGLAFKRRKDQIFDTQCGFVQLRASAPDTDKKVQRWRLCSVTNTGSTGITGSCTCESCGEKNNSVINKNLYIEPGAQHPVQHGLPVTPEKPIFLPFDDDPEERNAIQNE